MSNFKIIKKGYSQLEVDSYIEKLKGDYEARLAEQKDRIFYLKDQLDKITNSSDNELVTSLVGAVERARQIETSSKNIYELETKKLSLLYTKMENLLQDENICNDKNIKQELLMLIQDCRHSLEKNITAQRENIRETTSGDPVKSLLSKMIDFNKVTADYMLTKKEEKLIEENNKKTIKIIPTNEVIRKEVPSSVKVVQVRRQDTKEKQNQQAQNVLSNNATTNEFNKFLSNNSDINGANFESIMFTKSSSGSRISNSTLARRRERIRENKALSKISQRESNNIGNEYISKNSESTKISANKEEKSRSSTYSKEHETYNNLSKSSINSTIQSSRSSKDSISDSSVSQRVSNSSSKSHSEKILSSNQDYKIQSRANDDIEISSKKSSTKENDLSALGIGASIFATSKTKKEDSLNGNYKSETGEMSVTGSSGNTSFTATSSYKTSSYSKSTSSTSNPNDELSDEEFLRAYLGDLEAEEMENNKSNSSSIKVSSKSTQSSYSATYSSSSTSKKSSNNSYVTGGRFGDYSPNETGFDLKEAVNPKEDLDEIMKAFDFFNDNKKKK